MLLNFRHFLEIILLVKINLTLFIYRLLEAKAVILVWKVE
jgi:hypothetical protein